MRTAHTDLLRFYRDKGASPDLLARADAFLVAGAATGALIDGDDDRMGAQSLLDYWAAVLSRAERPPTQSVLADFDPALAPELPDSLCPYVGLEAFGDATRKLLFGREQVLSDIADRLREHRFLAVVGPLGSGKSSLTLGGVVPKLRAGLLPGSQHWRYYPAFTPGDDPLASLARAVGAPDAGDRHDWTAAKLVDFIDRGGDQPAVIVVDRFEELFSICQRPERRDAFADTLLGLVASPKQHMVLATLRSDFEAQIAAVPQLHQPFERAAFRLPPLSASELRDAICQPAEQVGLKFEAGLVDRLVKEILGEPAGLPLLQFTLLKLWDLRDHNRITQAAYKQIGGARQALARSADALYERLSPQDQATLRTIMLLMVRPAIGMEVLTSAVRLTTASAKADRDSVDRVITALAGARLIRTLHGGAPDAASIELAHGALAWNWPRLAEWLDEERVAKRRRLRLTTAADQWNAHGRDPGGLLGGTLLDEGRTYDDLNPLEQEFISASATAAQEALDAEQRARDRELAHATALLTEQRRRADEQARAAVALTAKNRSLRALATLIVVLLVVATTGWIVAERARREAVRKQQTVEALMTGQGVVVEDSSQRPAAAAAAAIPEAEPAPPSTPGAPPRAAFAAPERTLSQVTLRAARRSTGRQISGTELPAYAFSLWVEAPPEVLSTIASVEYEFNHPTFRQKFRVGRDRASGFRVGYTGWGCLSTVVVSFTLRDATTPPPHIDFDMCAAVEASGNSAANAAATLPDRGQ
jgi:hypothetical protein